VFPRVGRGASKYYIILYQLMIVRDLSKDQNQYRAKIIFGGKLRSPYFCHIFGMERPFKKRACISLA
jgi:hypothetical protein